ncbi:hypothetical protein [Occallatibacter savannae]|uniref:hypothetical protein n=1 Tax=Occallatibacter savannae TaxID=1002691 RepID=UPI000D68B2B1|nr:hypothetical protein [Occallatibacter savannae]
MNAMETLLVGLFDYAGLYPPASLSLRTATDKYVEYACDRHASALGRFIINFDRLDELRAMVGDRLREFRLSVIVPDPDSLAVISREIKSGMPIEAVEMKFSDPGTIESVSKMIPESVNAYIEVPLDISGIAALQSISSAGMCAKIRMGGVIAEAFPSDGAVIEMLSALARLRLAFKATAGLHHPIRSVQPLTYEPQSANSKMHGFANLLCAAAVLYFGGVEREAERVLQEVDGSAWRVDGNYLQWRHLKWDRKQLATVRREFLIGIGTCSFDEPIHDMEALGWL